MRASAFTLALRGKPVYYEHLMRPNALLIVSLLVIFIAAPIVDAIACDDCKDILSLQDMQQCVTNGSDHSDDHETAQDPCPICANIAATMNNACCGVPSMISQGNRLPKLIAMSDPSYSITKPPQK